MHLNDLFERIVWINLDSRLDRRDSMVRQLDDLEIVSERFSAIDGSTLTNTGIIGAGGVGNLESHKEVVSRAMQDNVSSLLVLEDDCVFHPNFNDELNRVNIQSPDILYFGFNNVHVRKAHVSEGVWRLFEAYSIHAYGLFNRSAMEFILRKARMGDGSNYLDRYIGGSLSEVKAYGLYPPLILQSPGYSDILNRDVDYTYLHEEFK